MKLDPNGQIPTVARKFPGKNKTGANFWAINPTDVARRTTYYQIAPDHPVTAAATVGNRVIFALPVSKQQLTTPTPDQMTITNIWPARWPV